MTDKIKALVEAARALTTHIDRNWPEHGQVTNFHSKVLRAALDALDAEPEVVWHEVPARNRAVGSAVFVSFFASINGFRATVELWESGKRPWSAALSNRADGVRLIGHFASLELAKAAALRAARGES